MKPIPINHPELVDSFGALSGQRHYQDRDARCGGCGAKIVFSASAQKYVFEILRVPVSRINQGIARCTHCRKGRADENRRRADRVTRQAAILQAKRAWEAAPENGALLLDYAVARIEALTAPSPRTIQRLTEDLNRVRRLAPRLHLVDYWAGQLALAAGAAGAAEAALLAFLMAPGRRWKAERRRARAQVGF